MKYGIVTDVGRNLGTILSGEVKYRFAMAAYPKADFGQNVMFEEDLVNSEPNERYAKDIKYVGVLNEAIADLLVRVKALEVMLVRTTSNTDLTRVIEEDREYGSGAV